MSTMNSRTNTGILAAILALTVLPAAAQDGPDGALQAIAVGHNNAAVVYTSGQNSMWRSADSGNTWDIVGGGFFAWSIAIDTTDSIGDPDATQVIYAATQANGVIRSEGGTTWTAGNGLSGSVRSVAIHPDNTTVYAGAEDGIYVSRDRGLNWNILSNALGTGETQGLVVDPGNPRAIYATKWGQGVYRSIDGGISWDLGNGGLSDTQLFDLDLHPQNASILYAATWSGVFRSVDAGANWVELSSPNRVSELAIDPADPNRIIITTEGYGIARSTDGGETWTTVNQGLGDVTQFVGIAIAPGGSGAVYAGSVNNGIFISNDYGDTWSGDYTPTSSSTPPPSSTPPANRTTLSMRIVDRNGESVELGQTAYFDVVVRNTGSVVAQNAQVRLDWSQVGQGSYAMSARRPGGSCADDICNLGSLSVNGEVVINVEGRTGDAYNWVGPFRLVATADADNANTTSASTDASVVRTILTISSEGGGGASGPFLFLVLFVLMLVRHEVADRKIAAVCRAEFVH